MAPATLLKVRKRREPFLRVAFLGLPIFHLLNEVMSIKSIKLILLESCIFIFLSLLQSRLHKQITKSVFFFICTWFILTATGCDSWLKEILKLSNIENLEVLLQSREWIAKMFLYTNPTSGLRDFKPGSILCSNNANQGITVL